MVHTSQLELLVLCMWSNLKFSLAKGVDFSHGYLVSIHVPCLVVSLQVHVTATCTAMNIHIKLDFCTKQLNFIVCVAYVHSHWPICNNSV